MDAAQTSLALIEPAQVAGELIRYDAMCRAIADAFSTDEVKDIRDRAAALEHYARQARNTEAERQCCEIRLRAERRWGQLYSAGEKAKGGRPAKTPSGSAGVSTLHDLGVSEKQSSSWQKLGAVPDDQFETALAGSARPNAGRIIETVSPAPPVEPVSAAALWLWGRLRDFQRDGLLTQHPRDLLATMTPEMREDVRELAPLVADWLKWLGEVDGNPTAH
jgi:hypothetical protein